VRGIRHGLAIVAGFAAVSFTLPAAAEENPALLETLEIMRERGLIDEAKHAELVAKNQAWEASHPSLLSRLEWSGDFRGRLENFWYDRDDFGVSTADRTRGRYRLRIGARAKVNDIVTAGFKLASGDFDGDGSGSGCDWRSTNRSLGSGTEFNNDTLCIDEAYAELTMPERFLPEGTSIKSVIGKQANPFLWKQGKDLLIWDGDITPEGVSVQVNSTPGEQLSLFGNAAYFISDENSSSQDPHVTAFQAGFGYALAEETEVGARASWYGWGSSTAAFMTAGQSWGNLADQEFSIAELSGYARFSQIEDWPILLFAQIAQNLDAESVPGGGGDQDLGWGAGLEVGDKKKYLLVGAGYYRQEANFAPAQFVDSDLFDGYTNRKGWLVWLGRQLWPNTELALTFFKGDSIDDGATFAIPDASSADRMRLQTDFIVKF
jgi:hypothetical protein